MADKTGVVEVHRVWTTQLDIPLWIPDLKGVNPPASKASASTSRKLRRYA
jgi:hypothetical protein